MAAVRHVVIVGAGPKALFCVERLTAHARRTGCSMEVIVCDPREPGTGAAYAHDQPATNRLNVAAEHIDAWWRTGPAPASASTPSFDEWRRARGDDLVDAFPARSRVGDYLAWCWHELVSDADSPLQITFRHTAVVSVTRSRRGWLLTTTDGEVLQADDVLLATGHARPVTAADADDVSPGATVLVRGAALTFLDVALQLTFGRGGTLDTDGQYRRSGHEPALLAPVGRSGTLMAPKPAAALFDSPDHLAARIRARAAIDETPATVPVVLAAVHDLARSYAAGADDAQLDLALAHPCPHARELAALVREAAGHAPPGPAMALGAAWRDCYASIIASLSFADMAVADWQRFVAAARLYERVAFGPPLDTARRLLALVDAGLVKLDHLGHASRWAAIRPAYDTHVEAIIAPPGVDPAHADALWEQLLRDGFVRVHPSRRGVVVNRNLECGPAGLACVGRPTEDVIIGNDTLVRTHHDGPERWARAVVERYVGARDA